MSEKGTHSPKHAFYGYPIPKEGPDTGFTRKYLENPVLRGTQLGIAAWAYVILSESISSTLLYWLMNMLLKILQRLKIPNSCQVPVEQCRLQRVTPV